MDNINTYLLWRGDLSFSQAEFNSVDNLVFCCLSYIRFQDVFQVTQKDALTIQEAAEIFFSQPIQKVRSEEDKELLRLLAESQRFKDVIIGNYVDHIDEAEEKQFSAMTLQFEHDKTYIAFRGTDNTLVGWKEDFNMTFLDTIPSQVDAVQYSNQIASKLPGIFYIGGHSKGGNLAVYAAAFCAEDLQKRICCIYNNDGPGFCESVLASTGYQRILTRIHTFVPQSSVVGMLLNHEEQYTVVKSTQISLWQHDPYSWQICQKQFVQMESIDWTSKFMDQTMKAWLQTLSVQQRAAFIDAMYAIIQATNAKSVKELNENKIKNITVIMKTLNKSDLQTKKMLNETLSAFFSSAKKAIAIMRPEHDHLLK